MSDMKIFNSTRLDRQLPIQPVKAIKSISNDKIKALIVPYAGYIFMVNIQFGLKIIVGNTL